MVLHPLKILKLSAILASGTKLPGSIIVVSVTWLMSLLPCISLDTLISYQSIRVSEYQSIRVSEYQSIRVSEYQSIRVSEYQSISDMVNLLTLFGFEPVSQSMDTILISLN